MEITFKDIIWAATEFQYFIETQPIGKLKAASIDGSFIDVRDTENFKRAKEILNLVQLTPNSGNCSICPCHMLFKAVSVGNVNPESGAVMPLDTPDVFKHIRHFLRDEELEVFDSICNRLKSNFSFCFVPDSISPLE